MRGVPSDLKHRVTIGFLDDSPKPRRDLCRRTLEQQMSKRNLGESDDRHVFRRGSIKSCHGRRSGYVLLVGWI
jgi:hypothetical protein